MTNETVFQSARRRSSLLNLRRAADFMAKIASFAELLLAVALYFGAVVLTIYSSDCLEIPPARELTLRQAITSELLLVTPAYLAMTVRWLRWLPCSLYLGCTTGVYLAVSGLDSAWNLGLLLTRLFLALTAKSRQDGRSVQFAALTVIGAVLKHFG